MCVSSLLESRRLFLFFLWFERSYHMDFVYIIYKGQHFVLFIAFCSFSSMEAFPAALLPCRGCSFLSVPNNPTKQPGMAKSRPVRTGQRSLGTCCLTMGRIWSSSCHCLQERSGNSCFRAHVYAEYVYVCHWVYGLLYMHSPLCVYL